MTGENTDIRRRHVLYLSGFDPRGAKYYHRLYKDNAALQSQVNGIHFDIGPRYTSSSVSDSWTVQAMHTETVIEFLKWNDIASKLWIRNFFAALNALYLYLRVYFFSGLIAKFARTSPRRLISAFYPLVYLLATPLIAIHAGFYMFKALHGISGLMAGSGVALLLLSLAAYGAKRFAVFWLLAVYRFSALWALGNLPLEEKLEAFAARILRIVADDTADEIMIVAHSVGTMLAIPLLAKVLDRMPDDARSPIILVTLGQCIPLISFCPQAVDYRRSLGKVAQDKRIRWVDYSAPTDGACFPLLDPVRASGIELGAEAGPELRSPRFFKLYNADNYRRLRYKWYTMHFLYLMATDHAGAYDYFRMTAGPQAFFSSPEKAA